jgi:hypothetical protein
MLIVSWLLIQTVCSFAQTAYNETLTISTYYPSPAGVYKALRLYPGSTPTVGVAPGMLYYNTTEDRVKYYNNTGVWLPLGAACHLGTFSATTGTTDCPAGYYVYSGLGATSGYMLCCQVDNPV